MVLVKAAILQLGPEQEKAVRRMEELVLIHGHSRERARYKITVYMYKRVNFAAPFRADR